MRLIAFIIVLAAIVTAATITRYEEPQGFAVITPRVVSVSVTSLDTIEPPGLSLSSEEDRTQLFREFQQSLPK